MVIGIRIVIAADCDAGRIREVVKNKHRNTKEQERKSQDNKTIQILRDQATPTYIHIHSHT